MELSTPALGRLVRDPALLDEGVLLVDSGDARWPIVYANTAAAELAGETCCCCAASIAASQTHVHPPSWLHVGLLVSIVAGHPPKLLRLARHVFTVSLRCLLGSLPRAAAV